jgi:dihydrofolate synthase/folylpolyglutamate synthase
MKYAEARALLDRLPRLEVKPGLERIRRLLDHLGHPEETFPSIHIAGTNGKGSVAAMLSSILHEAGYRTGCFTSPDVVDFRDRIRIDGGWISEEALASAVERLLPVLVDSDDPPTLFEALTAVAFDDFAGSGVDIAVVEVGLGGRFDATNVVRPLLTILTNVDRDHLALLGDSLEQIAWEKAGIAKPDVPFLIGDLSAAVRSVVVEECRRVKARIMTGELPGVERENFNWERATYWIHGGKELPDRVHLSLLGSYQAENLRLVLAAVEILRKVDWGIPNDAITRGLATVEWPCRFEVVRRDPTVVLDGAHNPAGVKALSTDIVRLVPDICRRHLLCGILADKEVEAIGRTLFPLFDRITFTRSKSPRAASVEQLAKIASTLDVSSRGTTSVEEGLRVALERLIPQDTLFVTGSLTVAREARPLLREAVCRH